MSGDLLIRRRGSESADPMTQVMGIAFDRALCFDSRISSEALAIPGMSGRLYRMFINNLVRMTSNARYLEIGSWAGSTACAAMDKNVAQILCIDNWSQFGGPKDRFFANIETHTNSNVDFSFIESDFRNVEADKLGLFNIYLFDGPHEEQDQYDGLHLFSNALEDHVYFIVDDWNWQQVRAGTIKAIRDVGFTIDYAIEVRTTFNEDHGAVHGADSDWHNGYFISKLARREPRASY